jgi:mxaL protein
MSARAVGCIVALERYVIDLWDAAQTPQKFGAHLDGVDLNKLVAGASLRGLMALARAANEIEPRPSVIFLTDGQEAPPLESGDIPLFDDLKNADIHGAIVGVGVGGDVPRPTPKSDIDSKPLGYWHAEDVVQLEGSTDPLAHERLFSMREPHLRALARQTGLDFARLHDFDALAAALSERRYGLDRRVATDMDWLPLGIALLLLAWRFWSARTRSS